MNDEHVCNGAFDGCTTCQSVHDECLRVERWHATYNAALTGIMASPATALRCTGQPDDVIVGRADESARMHANKAHGPLVKP